MAVEIQERFGDGFRQMAEKVSLKINKSVLVWLIKENVYSPQETNQITCKYLAEKDAPNLISEFESTRKYSEVSE